METRGNCTNCGSTYEACRSRVGSYPRLCCPKCRKGTAHHPVKESK